MHENEFTCSTFGQCFSNWMNAQQCEKHRKTPGDMQQLSTLIGCFFGCFVIKVILDGCCCCGYLR